MMRFVFIYIFILCFPHYFFSPTVECRVLLCLFSVIQCQTLGQVCGTHDYHTFQRSHFSVNKNFSDGAGEMLGRIN